MSVEQQPHDWPVCCPRRALHDDSVCPRELSAAETHVHTHREDFDHGHERIHCLPIEVVASQLAEYGQHLGGWQRRALGSI